MTFPLGQAPDGLQISDFAQAVLDIVARYTAFPWPIILVQCQRLDIDPSTMSPADLSHVAKRISSGVARFSSERNGAQLFVELKALMQAES